MRNPTGYFCQGAKPSEPGKLHSVPLFVLPQGAASVILVVAPGPVPEECKLAQQESSGPV